MSKNDVADNDESLFEQEMQGVKRLRFNSARDRKVASETPGKRVRRQLAQTQQCSADPLSSAHVPMLKSNDVLAFRRDGVQLGVYKKLRMGRYQIDARLDLHRMTVEQARQEVFRFISDCVEYELRTVIILHGKGDRNPEGHALLKSHLAVWLPQITDVMAFHSAQTHHGGTGAVYVLLRKGEKSKQTNREQHGLRA